MDWHGRGRPQREDVNPSTLCLQCRKGFVGRLFDVDVQLPLAGWQKVGQAWKCPKCSKARTEPPPRPRPVAVCSECDATFGIAHVPEEQIEARGWRKLGDVWVCATCAEAIAREDD